MKKKFLALMLILVLALSMVMMAVGCQNDDPTQNPDQNGNTNANDTFKVVLVAKDGTTNEYVIDMALLEGKNDGESAVMQLIGNHEVGVTWQDSQYGKYLLKIGIVEPTESNEYVAIYTSVEKDKDVSAYAKTIDYKGTELTTSGFGISSMTVEKDCIIYFTVGSY